MITKYDNYIKENFNDKKIFYNKIIKFINNYFITNKVEKYNNITEINNINNNLYNINMNFDSSNYFNIYFKIDKISIFGFDDADIVDYSEIDKCIDIINKKLDDYYIEYLKGYKDLRNCISMLPILNITNYLNTLEHVIYNNIDNKIIINDFIINIYNNELCSDLKIDFDKRFKHLINANNFDLI